MADTKTTIHLGENSPEHVAYKLLNHIAHLESKSLNGSIDHPERNASRKWLLDTYAECVNAVRGHRPS